MIAVSAASGQLGRLVLAALGARGTPAVALARKPESLSGLPNAGLRAFDYTQPEQMQAALAGIDTLLLISSNEIGQRAAQHGAAIAAAKAAGVGHIVYTSLLNAAESQLSLAPEHVATEAALKESGLGYTILRNGWYSENYTGAIGGALAGGAVIGAAGAGRISSAARADYAEAAAVVLTSPGHSGKTYELAGDDSYSLAEFAAEIARQTGRDIGYKDLGEAGYAKALEGFGLDAGFAAAIAGWDAAAADGALFSQDRSLSGLIGRPTTPIADTIRAALAGL